jgi:hypothetical protein
VPEADLLSLFVRPLNQLGWAYAVTGAVGSMFYSEPRFTNDIDVVVRIPSDGGPELRKAFPEPEFYRPGLEEISVEASRPSRGHLNVIHLESGLKADFYLVGTDPLNDWALSAAKIILVGDLPVRGISYFVALSMPDSTRSSSGCFRDDRGRDGCRSSSGLDCSLSSQRSGPSGPSRAS